MMILIIIFNLAMRFKHGQVKICCRVLMGKPKGKKPLGRPRRRWKNNIKMVLQEVGWGTRT